MLCAQQRAKSTPRAAQRVDDLVCLLRTPQDNQTRSRALERLAELCTESKDAKSTRDHAVVDTNANKAVESGVFGTIVELMKEDNSPTAEMIKAAVRALFNLTVGAETEALERKQKAVDAGVLSAVVSTMDHDNHVRIHHVTFKQFREDALALFSAIAVGLDEKATARKEQIVECGALEKISAIMTTAGPQELAGCCSSIQHIVVGIAPLQQRAAGLDMIEATVKFFRAYALERKARHGITSELLVSGCRALITLIEGNDEHANHRAATAKAANAIRAIESLLSETKKPLIDCDHIEEWTYLKDALAGAPAGRREVD